MLGNSSKEKKGRCVMKGLDHYRAAMVVAEIIGLVLVVGGSANADFLFGELT